MTPPNRWTRPVALLAIACAVLALLPPSRAIETPATVVETKSINIFSVVAGSNYYVKSSCSNGGSCIHVNPGGYVTYEFTVGQRVDEVFVAHTGSNPTGTHCGHFLDYTTTYGTPGHASDSFPCPSSYPWGYRAGAEFHDRFEPSSVSGTYRVTIECTVPYYDCRGFDLHTLTVEAAHSPLIMWTWWDAGTAVAVRCLNVQLIGSLWYAPDYVRITWGDGTETVETPSEDLWMLNWGFYEKKFCHVFAPSTSPYQVCVSAHDVLGRFLRECSDVRWLST